MNVRELIEELEQYLDDEENGPEVRLAFQPSWPLQYHVDRVVPFDADADDGRDEAVVYIAEGGQVYDRPYLPGDAARELGWKE